MTYFFFCYAGYEWVGWRNDTPGWAGHPLEILFEFDKVRNFSAVHLHTNNLFTKDVQVITNKSLNDSVAINSLLNKCQLCHLLDKL